MKKLFLFISIISIAFAACKKDDDSSTGGGSTSTAISITSSDLANAGDTLIMNVDTTDLTGFSIGTPGQNITWDFSAATMDRMDTTLFYAPANTPGGTYFPTASMAVQPQAGQPIYMYINKTTDKIEGIGMWANFQGVEVHADYTDRITMLKLPSSYGTTFSDEGLLSIITNYSTYWGKVVIRQNYSSEMDGSGTVKLPNNTSFVCLREKRTEIQYDSIYVGLTQYGPWTPYQTTQDTTFLYNFFAKNQKWNVASVKVNNFDSNTITEISYKK